jgi:hypothetical protein
MRLTPSTIFKASFTLYMLSLSIKFMKDLNEEMEYSNRIKKRIYK